METSISTAPVPAWLNHWKFWRKSSTRTASTSATRERAGKDCKWLLAGAHGRDSCRLHRAVHHQPVMRNLADQLRVLSGAARLGHIAVHAQPVAFHHLLLACGTAHYNNGDLPGALFLLEMPQNLQT